MFLLESSPAILKDYKLSFDIKAMQLVEPAFANVNKASGEEVHGVALCMTGKDMRHLDKYESNGPQNNISNLFNLSYCRQEPYSKHYVTLTAYDGRELNGFIYIKENLEGQHKPSARYLGVLIKGKAIMHAHFHALIAHIE